jgi:hypothetical protein
LICPIKLHRVALVSIVIFLTAFVFLFILLFFVFGLFPQQNIAGNERSGGSGAKYSGFIRCMPMVRRIPVPAPHGARAVSRAKGTDD